MEAEAYCNDKTLPDEAECPDKTSPLFGLGTLEEVGTPSLPTCCHVLIKSTPGARSGE